LRNSQESALAGTDGRTVSINRNKTERQCIGISPVMVANTKRTPGEAIT
jgi:hypothetical protein